MRALIQRVRHASVTVDDEVVLKRLAQRELNKEEMDRRMQDDQKFWNQFKDKYNYVVENIPGKLEKAVSEICQIIDSQL